MRPLILEPAMPASPIARNYLNERWASLEVYGTRAPFRRKLRGQHKQIVTAKRLENEQSKMPHGTCAALAWARGLKTIAQSPRPLTQTVISNDCH